MRSARKSTSSTRSRPTSLAQAVAVGDQEQRPVTRIRPRGGEQAGDLLQREELDRVSRGTRHPLSLGISRTARNNRFEQFHRPRATRSQAKASESRPPPPPVSHCKEQF